MSNNKYELKAWEVYRALPKDVKQELDEKEKKSFLWHVADNIEKYNLIGIGAGAIASYMVSMDRNNDHNEAIEDAGLGAMLGFGVEKGLKSIFHTIKGWL